MGMGYGAGYADVVEESFIKKHSPSEFKAFMAAIERAHISLDEAAKAIEYDDQDLLCESIQNVWEGRSLLTREHQFYRESNEKEIKEFFLKGLIKEIDKAWTSLRRSFNRKTGLSLDMGFHDKDNEGDRYDDINGYYFCVGNVWIRTRPGQKYARNISRKMFVTYG